MSRSKKKTPKTPFTSAVTDKPWKKEVNRKYRRKVSVFIQKMDEESDVLPLPFDIANQWSCDKDGKMFFDPEKYPEYLRK